MFVCRNPDTYAGLEAFWRRQHEDLSFSTEYRVFQDLKAETHTGQIIVVCCRGEREERVENALPILRRDPIAVVHEIDLNPFPYARCSDENFSMIVVNSPDGFDRVCEEIGQD